MIYELVTAVWLCTGTVTLLGFKLPLASFPEEAKPALAAVHLCRPDVQIEKFDPARRELAFARARADGAVRLRRCRGVRCRDVEIRRTTVVTVEDHPEEGP